MSSTDVPGFSPTSASSPTLYSLKLPSQQCTSGHQSGGASALHQLRKSIEATSLHVDQVMDRGKKLINCGRGSRGGGSSQKRSRSSQAASPNAYDAKVGEGLPVLKSGCSSSRQRVGNDEKVEKAPNRKSQGQGSKRKERKGCQQSASTMSDQFQLKGRSTSSVGRAGATGILDLYGLKAKIVDLTRHMTDIPLGQLLLGTYVQPDIGEKDVGGNEGNLEKLVNNVMNILSKPFAGSLSLSASGADSANAPNLEGQSSKPCLDLESPFQPEEAPTENSERKTSIENFSKDPPLPFDKGTDIGTNRSGENYISMLELSTKFSVDSLPDLPLDEFFSRLKLPPSAPLDIFFSESKVEGAAEAAEVADVFGSFVSSSGHGYSIPPLPCSFPILSPLKMHADSERSVKSGKVCERRWFKGGSNEHDEKGQLALIEKAAENAQNRMLLASGLQKQVVPNSSVHAILDAPGNAQNCFPAATNPNPGVCGSSQAHVVDVHMFECPVESYAGKESDPFALCGEEKFVLQEGPIAMQEVVCKQKAPLYSSQLMSTSKFPGKYEPGIPKVHGRPYEMHIMENHQHGLQPDEDKASKQAVAPYSSRVQEAAQILCSMAKSVPPLSHGKGHFDVGKRQRFFQPDSGGSVPRASKVARADSSIGRFPVSLHMKREETGLIIGADGSTNSKKVSTFEKRKSITQVNQISATVERISGSSREPEGGAFNHALGSFALLSAQSGSPSTKLEGGHHFSKGLGQEANTGDCSVAPKFLSRTCQPGQPSKESLTLKVRTFTGGPPKQKRVMSTNFSKVSLNSSSSKGGAESSRPPQRVAPSPLDSVLGSKAEKSFAVPVKPWRKHSSLEKQDTRQKQDSRFAKPSRD